MRLMTRLKLKIFHQYYVQKKFDRYWSDIILTDINNEDFDNVTIFILTNLDDLYLGKYFWKLLKKEKNLSIVVASLMAYYQGTKYVKDIHHLFIECGK